jgi:hypothetical protein
MAKTFTYQADTYCERHGATELVRVAIANDAITGTVAGDLASAALDLAFASLSEWQVSALVEALLDRAAEALGVDREDLYSFDSDDFPKPGETESDEVCATCGIVISDGRTVAEIEAAPAAVQSMLEGLAWSITSELEEESLMCRVFDRPESFDVAREIASRIIHAELDASRQGTPSELPHPTYAGLVL